MIETQFFSPTGFGFENNLNWLNSTTTFLQGLFRCCFIFFKLCFVLNEAPTAYIVIFLNGAIATDGLV